MKTYDVFEVIATYINSEQKKEYTLNILFNASSKKEAIASGHRWALNRQKAVFDDCVLFHILVREYSIQTVEDDGYCRTFGGAHIFEWRQDHSAPLTLDEALKNEKS